MSVRTDVASRQLLRKGGNDARLSTLTLGASWTRPSTTRPRSQPNRPIRRRRFGYENNDIVCSRPTDEAVLSKVDELRFIVNAGPRSRGPLGRRWRWRLRWRWLVRYFVVDHIRRSLAATKRHYHKQAALADDPAIHDGDLAVIENYEKSLPPVGVKHFLLLSIVLVLGLTLLMTRAIARFLIPRLGAPSHRSSATSSAHR